jgi:hypothetical protein
MGSTLPPAFPILKSRRTRGPLIAQSDGEYRGTPYKQMTAAELGVTRDDGDRLLWFGFTADHSQMTVGGVSSLDELKRIVDGALSIEAHL